jgi:hypothetical protein
VGRAGRAVLERLAFDQPFTEEDAHAIRRQVEAEKAAGDLLSAEPVIAKTAGGKSLAVYDTSDKPGVFLGRKVFEHHEVEYCLIRISLRKWQIASRPAHDLPLAVLIGSHDLDGMKIVAAGRPKRLLSIEVSAPLAVPPDAHEQVTALVQHLL